MQAQADGAQVAHRQGDDGGRGGQGDKEKWEKNDERLIWRFAEQMERVAQVPLMDVELPTVAPLKDMKVALTDVDLPIAALLMKVELPRR